MKLCPIILGLLDHCYSQIILLINSNKILTKYSGRITEVRHYVDYSDPLLPFVKRFQTV